MSVLVVGAGAVAFHGATTATRFDHRVSTVIARHIGSDWQLRALDLTSPRVVTALIVVTAVVAAVLRQRRLAVLAALGPPLALGLTELVLKPLVHRRFPQFDDQPKAARVLSGDAYPSGHETGLSSLTLLLVVAVGVWTTARVLRVVAVLIAGAVDVVGGIGLVGREFHLATDVVAAVGVSTAVLLGLALALDRVSSPCGRGPSRTAPEA